MRSIIIAAAALVAIGGAAHASSADNAALVCNITDSERQQPDLRIRRNTETTYVETGFRKNGKNVISDVGQRPVWHSFSKAHAMVVSSQDAPGWYLTIHDGGTTVLKHNDRLAGTGECISPRYGKSRDVGDVGNVADMGGE